MVNAFFTHPFGFFALFFQLIVLFWGFTDQIIRLRRANKAERRRVSLPLFGLTLLASLAWAFHSSLEIWNPFVFFVQIPSIIFSAWIVIMLLRSYLHPSHP